ncbi:unnamed protein product [Urochloa decumbens]|uniref:C2H2-type domain-containing protein n=1 Tax=Urochloa decumbens TaxID=240449 RepID=A0ABC8ZWD7_9POAL
MAMVMENQQPLAPMPPLVVVPAPPPLPPPPPPPPPQAFKHRCRVCKKGFVCGRALGGHMRAHGVTDDDVLSGGDDDDDAIDGDAGDSSEAAGSASASAAAATARRMYALRTNPGRLKSCRVCENCGKEFTSWKSLLDHGKCHFDEEEGDLDGGGNIGDADADNNDGEEGEELALAGGWSKGKRTRRAKVTVVGNGAVTEEHVPAPSSEEEDLANFLVMLSSSSSSAATAAAARPHHKVVVEVDQDVASKKEQRNHHHQLLVPQPISMVAPAVPPQLKLLAPPQVLPVPVPAQHAVVSTVPRGMFECKACKKVFTSHQALGGHRASHKKVKGCFAAKLESNNNNRNDPPPQPQPAVAASATENVIVNAIPAAIDANTVNSAGTAVAVVAAAADEAPAAPSFAAAAPFKKKGKVHECSICHRVFMSGQALGGHKRCHWLTTGGGDPGAVAKLQPYVTQDHVMHAMCQQLTLGRPQATMFDAASDPFLDLNVPTTTNPSPAAANDSVLSLTAPAAELYMQSWGAGHSNASNMNNTATSGHYDAAAAAAVTEDEADSTSAKRAKISDLKDMNMGGETSPWLQVGIGLPSEVDEEKATQA